MTAAADAAPVTTPDGRYLIVRGRLWRTANPHLREDVRAGLVAALMDARRAVKAAKRDEDAGRLAQRVRRSTVPRRRWESAARCGGAMAPKTSIGIWSRTRRTRTGLRRLPRPRPECALQRARRAAACNDKARESRALSAGSTAQRCRAAEQAAALSARWVRPVHGIGKGHSDTPVPEAPFVPTRRLLANGVSRS